MLSDIYYKEMCFHVISSAAWHIIYFLRDYDSYPMAREELQLYIDHALDDTFVIDHYKLKIQNPHLSTHVKPVIETSYFDQESKKTKIQYIIDNLTSFVKPNNMIVELIDYPEPSSIYDDNIYNYGYRLYCYKNIKTNVFTLLSDEYRHNYFPHFKLEWKLGCTQDTHKFIFSNSNNIIRTTDECLINAYKMFAEQLQKQQLGGYDEIIRVDGMPAVGGLWKPKDEHLHIINNKHGTYKNNIKTRDISELTPITTEPKYECLDVDIK